MDVYGLIGFPLAHSFSKKYFTEKFREERIADTKFELFPLKTIAEIDELLSSNRTLKGLAVTIPYKVSVMPFLSKIEPSANAIGAVNCIKILPDKLIGYNTDFVGFEKSLLPLLNSHHRGALVLGNGGAAKAVRFVLKKLNLPYLVITRDNNNVDGHLHYDQLNAGLLNNYPVIINCTPVGMHPFEDQQPAIPYSLLNSNNLLYDLIYNPEETLFLKEGKAKGCQVKNGFEMLCIQAEENWKIWRSDSID